MTVQDLGLKDTDYTAIASLHLAAQLGATSIDVYGADWSQGYFDGHAPADVNHGPPRWAREREMWDRTCDWLSERGIHTRRMNGAD
jgi:hypothetical protein